MFQTLRGFFRFDQKILHNLSFFFFSKFSVHVFSVLKSQSQFLVNLLLGVLSIIFNHLQIYELKFCQLRFHQLSFYQK